MSMQIRAIIVYGKNGQRRVLPFRLNDVNIITGKSGTGKTALSDILDYCLGRNTCNVAHGVIRNTVAWYALHLQFLDTQAFVARRNPDPEANTNPDILFQTAKLITLPESPEELVPNITEQGLNDALSTLMGITPNENVPPAGTTRRALRATLDHAKFLVFQGQSEIFDRDILFHRQKEEFIPQAIKDTLPYFIGAVPDTSLMLREQLRVAKLELGRLRRQQIEADRIAGEGDSRANSLLSEATEVGLIQVDGAATPRIQLVALRDEDSGAMVRRNYDFGEEANRLRAELAAARQEYQELQVQARSASEFNSAQSLFETEAQSHASRLEIVGILPNNEGDAHMCPLCKSELDEPVPAAADLEESLRKLRSELDGVGSNRPRVDEYLIRLQAQQQVVRQRMSDIRQRLNSIEAQNRQAQLMFGLERRQAIVLGRVSLYLESVPEVKADASLGKRIHSLEVQIAEIEEKLQDETVREAVDSALSRISLWMTAGAKALEMEWQPNPHRLDIGLLTVVADTDVRPVRMTQMGSAANWLGCHLISHVALQKWFATKKRPVPRFLFLDQPTSAYYPPDDDEAKQGTDDDRIAVMRMYNWFIDSVQKADLKEKFQLIIVDHADLKDARFQACIVEKWRGEKALIPRDWTVPKPPAPSLEE